LKESKIYTLEVRDRNAMTIFVSLYWARLQAETRKNCLQSTSRQNGYPYATAYLPSDYNVFTARCYAVMPHHCRLSVYLSLIVTQARSHSYLYAFCLLLPDYVGGE